MQRDLGTNGENLIKSFEELRLESYLPTPDDVWTVGWGTTQGVRRGMAIDLITARRWFKRDVAQVVECVNKNCLIPVSQNQFDAMVSLVYNIGCSAFKSSTLLRLLNEGTDKPTVAKQFLRWDKQGSKTLAGLTRRRTSEAQLFLTPDEA